METADILFYILVSIAGIATLRFRLLTLPAAVSGVAIAILLFSAFNFLGIVLMLAFFILGNAATLYRRSEKKGRVRDEGPRKASQVFANAGIAAVIALYVLISKESSSIFKLMMAASFASATSDTLSSELGIVYGKNSFNILSFQKERAGLDGVVSLEGFAFGILGSAFIAVLFGFFEGWNVDVLVITAAGFAGNVADSLLGALFERKGKMNNDMVNFLNTVVGVVVAIVLSG